VSDLQIYNCHIHIFTSKNVPRNFLNLVCGPIFGPLVSWLLRWQPLATLLARSVKHPYPFLDNDLIKRYATLLATGNAGSPAKVLEGIQRQYPRDTMFVVLPMDMAYMDLGPVEEPIDQQHAVLLKIAAQSEGRVIPFYAADPRREGMVEDVRRNLAPDKFRGLKIYPNLGYYPQDDQLMKAYAICEERDAPVMTHCSSGGIWKQGLSYADRVRFSHPRNYEVILKTFPKLRYCLAHFGGSEEWDKHLESRGDREDDEQRAWVRWIADLIRSGEYPNLYTDISYIVFQPKPLELHVDYLDYLKVLLADERLRQRVLFGSDYYMSEREPMTEKEVSIALRSRLGEELYFQIAHHNPQRYLGLTRG